MTMTAMTDVNKILERALANASYRDRLLADPVAAAIEVGTTITDDEAATLKTMSVAELEQFAAEYRSSTDPAKRRAAC